MTKNTMVLTAAAVALTVTSASAQVAGPPISTELRGGTSFPTADFGEGDAVDTGWRFAGNVKLHFTPLLAAYVGYSRAVFGAGDDAGAIDGDVVDSGIGAGIHGSIPRRLLGVSPWVRGGVVYHRADLKGNFSGLSFSIESDRSLGFEAGAGFAFPLGRRLSITPGVSYTSYGAEFEFQGQSFDEDLSYLTADVGLSARF